MYLPSCRTLASTVAGHFGEFLQGRLGRHGPLALVTVPAPGFHATARLAPAGPFRFRPIGPTPIDRRQASAMHRAVAGAPRGRLSLQLTMPPGGGAGSSTAALLAVAAVGAASRGRALPDLAALAGLCLRLEGATDPLMHSHPERLLWAPREAQVLAAMPPIPELEIVGGFLGPGRRTRPDDTDFADISDLIRPWRDAATRGDARRVADISTRSARRNAAHRGREPLDRWLAAARRHGALGLVAAHTGSAIGLIFAPQRGHPDRAAVELSAHGLAGVTRFIAGGTAG